MQSKETHQYTKQLNKVQDYIERHLDQPVTVKELAEIAHFSPFHFQKIYTYMTGESIYAFIKRIRLEKAAYMLMADKNRSITDIALSVGFSNPSAFAKAFKAKYGASGTAYRQANLNADAIEAEQPLETEKKQIIEPLSVEIRKEKDLKLIYLRYTGPYKGDAELFSKLFNRLYSWADQRHLVSETSRWFVIYHDFSEETDEDKLRLSVCMSIKGNVAVSEDIGILTLEAGLYGVGQFRLNEKEYYEAWQYMYTQWLPQNGYYADDRFSLEHYPHDTGQDDRRLVEIYIPVVKTI